MTKTKSPKPKLYAIVRGTYDGAIGSPLGPIPCTSGPYEILEEGLVDRDAARARVAEIQSELNPRRLAGKADVFLTNRVEDYRPRPERYSTYEIRAWYAYRGPDAPLEISLKDVRRRPSGFKQFKDYVKRIRTAEAEAKKSLRGRVYGPLTRAELVRHDWYKGKPAGLEVVATLADLP